MNTFRNELIMGIIFVLSSTTLSFLASVMAEQWRSTYSGDWMLAATWVLGIFAVAGVALAQIALLVELMERFDNRAKRVAGRTEYKQSTVRDFEG